MGKSEAMSPEEIRERILEERHEEQEIIPIKKMTKADHAKTRQRKLDLEESREIERMMEGECFKTLDQNPNTANATGGWKDSIWSQRVAKSRGWAPRS